MMVVMTTTMTTGPKKLEPSSPHCWPLPVILIAAQLRAQAASDDLDKDCHKRQEYGKQDDLCRHGGQFHLKSDACKEYGRQE